MMKNYGLDILKERESRSPDDWVFGAFSQPCITDIAESERERYLPMGEVQAGREDMMDCASRGPLNILEAKFNWLSQNLRLLPENRKWLEDNGYFEGGRIVFSDAFVAINSETTKRGNSMKAPLDAIRKKGLIPKYMLPLEGWMTWDAYHNPARITAEMNRLGLEFASRFAINYEKVFEVHYPELLKGDFLNVGGYAWPVPVDGIYPRVPNDPNHVWVNFKNKYFAFDNYEEAPKDFVKHLAPDYDFLEYGYRVYISAQSTGDQRHLNWIQQILWGLADVIASLFRKKGLPLSDEPESPVLDKTDTSRIKDWAGAIEVYENTAKWRNNPGAIKGLDGKLLAFKTYEAGFSYLCDYLTRACTGKHKAYKPEFTILQFFEVYAPEADGNDPKKYADFVAKKLKVAVTINIKELL